MATRKPYPTDISDEEWALIRPYLELLPETSKLSVKNPTFKCTLCKLYCCDQLPPHSDYHLLAIVEPFQVAVTAPSENERWLKRQAGSYGHFLKHSLL